MSTLFILKVKVRGSVPVISDQLGAGEALTVSTTTAPSTVTIGEGEHWHLYPVGADMWVDFGLTPVAVVGEGLPLKDGVPVTISGSEDYKIAAIEA